MTRRASWSRWSASRMALAVARSNSPWSALPLASRPRSPGTGDRPRAAVARSHPATAVDRRSERDPARLQRRRDHGCREPTRRRRARAPATPGRAERYIVAPRRRPQLDGTIAVLHSGPQRFVEAATGCSGRMRRSCRDPTSARSRSASSNRAYTASRSLPLPERLTGLTGPHDSRAAGRRRRVPRHRPLHGRGPAAPHRLACDGATCAGARANSMCAARWRPRMRPILIVLDSRDDVTDGVAEWSSGAPATGVSARSTSRGRRRARSPRAYIAAGDRVGFHDLADARPRALRPGRAPGISPRAGRDRAHRGRSGSRPTGCGRPGRPRAR